VPAAVAVCMQRLGVMRMQPPSAARLSSHPNAAEFSALVRGMLDFARAAYEKDEMGEAERLCLKLLARDVHNPEGLNLLGRVMHSTGRTEAAVNMYRRAIRVNSVNASHHTNLGLALMDLGREDEALESLLCAVQLDPGLAEAHNNLGTLLLEQGKMDAAMREFHLSLRLKPDCVPARNNLGASYSDLGDHDPAIAEFDRALELDPSYTRARWNRALAQLLQGNYIEGWQDYEARWLRADPPRCFSCPQWKGEPLQGARILLHSEQGLGDSLQCFRYIPLVHAGGGSVILDVPPGLKRLAEQLPGVAQLTVAGRELPPFDLHCPLMSLPLAFGTTPETIPNRFPYVSVPPEAAEAAAKIPWSTSGPRVGLIWSGNPRHRRDRFRSIPIDCFQPILDLPGIHFYSLQIGPGASPLEQPGPLAARITHLAPHISDLADTAAILEHLDLLLTVDTSVVHLAGALARPVWVLVPAAPDWRWMRGRVDSLWYPTARLFRQFNWFQWQPVLEHVREALLQRFGTSVANR